MIQFLRLWPRFTVILLLTLCCSGMNEANARVANEETSLISMLISNYDKVVRPTKRPTDIILVSFGITLIKIIDVDPTFQCLTTYVWQTTEWNDWRLRWNPRYEANITSVKIPARLIWTPDVVLYTNGRKYYAPSFPTHVIVGSNGTVKHVEPYSMVTDCDVNPEVAEQNCSIPFGSWSYGLSELNLGLQSYRGADLSKYIPHKEWELLGVPGTRTEKRNSWLPEPYAEIAYNVLVRRINSSPG